MIDFVERYLVFTLVEIFDMQATDIYRDKLDQSWEEKPALPSSINVLTILTFIGSGLGLVYLACMPMLNKLMLGFMEKATSSGEDIPASKLADIEQAKSMIELSQANIIPIMATGAIGIILCIVGAVWMRKLKKDGYWLYVAGELLPLIASFIILGTAQFTGVGSVIMIVGIPLLFISLYTMQLKFLVR